MNSIPSRGWIWLAAAVLLWTISPDFSGQTPSTPLATKNDPQQPQLPAGVGNRPPPGQSFDLAVPAAPDPNLVARGKALYTANCSFCHGATATGGDSGPSLVRSTIVLHDRGEATTLGPFLAEGRPTKGMPKFAFDAEQNKDMAAFLSSRVIAAADRRQYQALNVVVGDPKNGERLFQEGCARCHSVSGDLEHIGTKYDGQRLQNHMLSPDVAKSLVVTLPDQSTFSGTLVGLDDFNVALVDSKGKYHSWPTVLHGRKLKIEVKDPAEAHLKLLGMIKDTEVRDLVSYLESHK